MSEFLRKLFDSDFMPHGHCYFWRPEIVWLHVTSDALIALAYFFIPFTLVHLVRKRPDLVFNWMFVLFSIFILACGATHAMAIWTLWHATYRLDGVVKLITAVASVPTAILLIRLVPEVVKLPSPEQLRSANLALAAEIAERKRAEEEVRKLNAQLELRVQERTLQLESSNLKLQQLNDALRRSNDDLNHFAYAASHDLKEPLRTVAVYSELLGKKYSGALDEKGEGFLRYLVEASHRMRDLLDNLLVYSRTVGGSEDPARAVDSNEVAAKALFSLQMLIHQTGAVVTHDDLPPVRAAEIHVLQLFQNLIENGIKYRGASVAEVHLSARRDGDFWIFCVTDNGIGIEPEYLTKIFGLFKRLHGSRYSGTGIGLALCSRIVDRYDGRIWVESVPGRGSKFFFTLPASNGASA
ncbi:MAG TPA: ATP-binding protein [Bryobacteraceae bacterium]|nr:ATP-binding protein [Bryobacteraceae bacterium]